MAALSHQIQPACPASFLSPNLSTQTYGTTLLENYGMQNLEDLANIADAHYHELEESQLARERLTEGALDAWGQDPNVISAGREENAQSKLLQRLSIPILLPWISRMWRKRCDHRQPDRHSLCRLRERRICKGSRKQKNDLIIILETDQ